MKKDDRNFNDDGHPLDQVVRCFFGTGLAIVIIAIIASWLMAATPAKIYWVSPLGESAYDIKLVKMADAWADADNTFGVYEGDSVYSFTVDYSDFDVIDGSSLYKIMENGSSVYEYIDIGAKNVNDTLRAHRLASTNVHGLSGGSSVVGTSQSQTLTNKTIDGDDNTISDIAGSSIKTDAVMPRHSVRPDGGVDTYLFFTSTADKVSLQASNAAKNDDDNLELITDTLKLVTDAGGAVKVTGLAAAAANGEAVRYNEFSALSARVDDLERDDAFSSNPGVSVFLNGRGYATVKVNWRMDPASDEDSCKRYEIYWSSSALQLAAGATDAAELAYLRQHANRVVIDGDEFKQYSLTTYDRVWVVVVAVDWVGVMENSDAETMAPVLPGVRRDEVGLSIQMAVPLFGAFDVAFPDTDSTSYIYELEQQGTTSKDAVTFIYAHAAENQTLRIRCHARAEAGSGNSGYVQVGLATYGAGSDAASVTYAVSLQSASYSATADVIDLDVSGLTAGTIYVGEVRIWATGTGYSLFVRGDISGEVIKEIGIY